MEKISCEIIKDLLPLYVDGVLNEKTVQAVRVHLETCDSCRNDYEIMKQEFVFPSAPKIQQENKKVLKDLKHRLKNRKILTAVVAALVTATIIISACMIYVHVGKVQDSFSQDTMVILRDIQTGGKWKQLEFGENDYLNFDNIFCEKKVTIDANSDSAVTLRISDADGNIVIDALTVQPGTSISLNELDRRTNYKVEIQADADFVLLRFD